MNYQEIKEKQAPMIECFFAFSNEQYYEAIKENNLQDKKIYKSNYGLFGTKEGIDQFLAFYDNLSKEIAENCKPQDVYNYEFSNYECDYVCDDSEAIKIVISYFGKEKAKTVKRKYAYNEIETD